MDGPNTVRLQRKRNELPPDQLYVERKRKHDQSVEESRGFYIRQRRDTDVPSTQVEPQVQDVESTKNGSSAQSAASALESRREYHLKPATTPAASLQSNKNRKRKSVDDFATVVEKRKRKADGNESVVPLNQIDEDGEQDSTLSAPPKRPGRGSAIRPQPKKAEPVNPENENVVARQQRERAALAQEMHLFALDELAKTPKPQIKTKPKLTPSRSRALHEQHVPASPSRVAPSKDADDDTVMDDDSEYVYDTYVLAPAPTSLNPNDPVDVRKTLSIPSNVGYLVITEDDEQLWETYIHDLEGSDSEPTDEDDENGTYIPSLTSQDFMYIRESHELTFFPAEDYYGADYPSDELATDDEFDRGGAAYGYRARRGSNDEQYDLDNDDDEPTWSDEEDMRMMNPFAKKESGSSRVERQFAKYLDRKKAAEEEDE